MWANAAAGMARTPAPTQTIVARRARTPIARQVIERRRLSRRLGGPRSPPGWDNRVMGDAGASNPALAVWADRRLTRGALLAHASGALVVAVFLIFLLPASRSAQSGYTTVVVRSAIALAVYFPISFWAADRWLRVGPFRTMVDWLESDRPAGESERRIVLRFPLSQAAVSGLMWGVAAVLFGAIGTAASPAIALTIALTILLGGVSTCAVSYLVAERRMRPITARALADGTPARPETPGVAARLTMSWALATAVPVLGVLALAATDLAGAGLDRHLLMGAILFVAVVALAVGWLATLMAARSVSEPRGAVRRALERGERGDLDASVPVDDGSEVGLLQAGFNRMVGGLRERERLRDAFGAFVDPQLTERVLAEGADLAGEEVEVSVMFVDVRGFTTFSERAAARDVVGRLNELFGLIVPIVLAHGGHAMKFIGDGLLAVFGAPERLPDHADRAVAAAKELAEAVRERFAGELSVGAGVNSGRVVAGTIGGGGRVDFTVIGDAVNTPARGGAASR